LPTNTANGERLVLLANIASTQADIDTWNSQVSGSLVDMQNISTGLSLTNADNFTENQQKNLQPFIIESSYINENIIQLDSMSASTVQEQSQKLYDQAVGVLENISEPRYTFSVESVNFMMIKDFESFMEETELGAIVNLEIKPGVISYPVLLGMDLNFDNPEEFSLIFGNRLRLDDEAFQFSDLMNEAINSATTSKVNSLMWNNWNDNYKDDVTNFINSALDAAVNNVTSGSNQEIIINKSGLRARQSATGGSTYSDEQLWIVNNMIAFTDDNWDSAKIAIGEITGPNGQVWGIVTEKISKKQILKYRTNTYDYN